MGTPAITNRVQALVVGGGISGLVCAYSLQKTGIEFLLVEASPRPGGVIQSQRREGFLIERGPQSFSGTYQISTLCSELGLTGDRVLAPVKAPRYVLIDGSLRQVPMNPLALFTSSLLNGETKWSLLRDLFGKTQPPEPDESVANFVRRKFSAQLLDRLAGPFVSGIYAGDPEKLSVRGAFPQLHEAEKASGSIARGMLKMARTKRGPHERPTLQTFQDGNEILVRALAKKLGERLRCGVEATALRTLAETQGGRAARYAVTLRADGREETLVSDQVVFATPADVVQKLLGDVDPGFEALLEGVEYAAAAVVSLGYRKADIAHALDGFGFLVPRSSGLRVLGSVWNSSLFPDRAPEGHALLTSFVGGASDPNATKLSAEELVAMVHREMTPVLGIRQAPVFSNVTVWQRALPQYNLGHSHRLAALEKLRLRFPGIWLAGNYLRGPAIGACVEQAQEVADEIKAGSIR